MKAEESQQKPNRVLVGDTANIRIQRHNNMLRPTYLQRDMCRIDVRSFLEGFWDKAVKLTTFVLSIVRSMGPQIVEWRLIQSTTKGEAATSVKRGES